MSNRTRDIPISNQKDYYRGYNAGSRNAWPDHKPPLPDDDILNPILKAAIELRDEADSICATLSDDDDISIDLGEKIDNFDEAMMSLSYWLKQRPRGDKKC